MIRFFYRKQATAGFTLLEMIVVVVILGVLAAIAGPGWVGFMNRRRADSARDQIQQAIKFAQAEALRTKRNQAVRFDTTVNPPIISVRGSQERLGGNTLSQGMVGLVLPTPVIWFDYNGNIDLATTGVNPPFTIKVQAPANTGRSRCIIVESILGAMRYAEQGEPNCT